MSKANLTNNFRSLDDWFYTSVGKKVSYAIINEIGQLFENFLGKNILQIGSCGLNHLTEKFHYHHQLILTPFTLSQGQQIVSDMLTIPLEKNSVDCVIAPFSIEIIRDVNHTLFEFDRVLKPEGFLIIVGINPWSLWGAAYKLGLLDQLSHALRKLYSSLTLKRILSHHDYQQVSHSNFYYIPPIFNEVYLGKLEFMNQIGKMLWPFPSAFYCLVMKKVIPGPSGLSYVLDQKIFQNQKSRIPSL